MTGEETLHFYGRLFKIPRAELNRRVPELLDIVGLDSKARKRKLREYSKGMARRIGLAQALINDPELILLDEPTTGLDPIGTREMKDLILSLKEQGKTVLLCSHLLADVQDVCDRVTILFRGKMQTLGDVRDLVQVKDVTQIETRGMSEPQIAELRQFMARMGLNDAVVTHPTTTLEDLFIRIVRENSPQLLGDGANGAGANGAGANGAGANGAGANGHGAAGNGAPAAAANGSTTKPGPTSQP